MSSSELQSDRAMAVNLELPCVSSIGVRVDGVGFYPGYETDERPIRRVRHTRAQKVAVKIMLQVTQIVRFLPVLEPLAAFKSAVFIFVTLVFADMI
jgi:hypothetical protein